MWTALTFDLCRSVRARVTAGVRAALLPLAVRQIQASSGLAMLLQQVCHNIAALGIAYIVVLEAC